MIGALRRLYAFWRPSGIPRFSGKLSVADPPLLERGRLSDFMLNEAWVSGANKCP